MNSSEGNRPTAAEERRDERRGGLCEPAALFPAAGPLELTVENVSTRGLFAVVDRGLEFEIKLQGEARTRRVQLVRSQSLPGGKAGLGFKFIDSEEGGRER
ncbi:hypothetical protein OAV47_00255 [bacterium]|nr:hypothetical protein [bacterium]